MSVPLVDMQAHLQSIQPEVENAISRVMRSGQFILGPEVSELEREIADRLSVEHCIGVASGTDALVIALRAFGIGPGDEVIVPAFTFFATAEAVLMVGATPVVVDIDPEMYTISIDQLAERITDRTRAVIPVHLYGQPADMDPILELASQHGLRVIEDNAQAFGAKYRGRTTGGIGDAGCLSFFPTKNLGGFGDGGMIATNDGDAAERMRMLRSHGWRRKYEPEIVGYNSRLDSIQAACLRALLPYVDGWNESRRSAAAHYSGRLASMGIQPPVEAEYGHHVYHLYMVGVDNRKEVRARLAEAGIGTAVYYPIPLHLTGPLLELGYTKGDFPIAEQASERILALPMYPEITNEQVDEVLAALQNVLDPEGVVA